MTAQFDSDISSLDQELLLLKYRGVIQHIGPMVEEFLPHGMLIFFGESAPHELREVSLVHDGHNLAAHIAVGDILQFIPPSTDDTQQPVRFRLTAVGDVANKNLAQLGHVVVHFDASSTPSLPGAISVEPSLTQLPSIGTTIEFIRLEKN